MDKKVKVIRGGEKEVSICFFSSLKAGDIIFIEGVPVLLSIDAHHSGDASYDGYLAYSKDNGIFPEDCDIADEDGKGDFVNI